MIEDPVEKKNKANLSFSTKFTLLTLQKEKLTLKIKDKKESGKDRRKKPTEL